MQVGDWGEDGNYIKTQLLTYLGNKRKLLPLIERAFTDIVKEEPDKKYAFADVFAGTGVVSRLARRWAGALYINDLEPYSAYINRVYHTNISALPDDLDFWRKKVNQIASQTPRPGFVTELYAPKDESCITKEDRVFYTRRNALFIDTARQEIEKVPKALQPFLLAPLLQRASVHVNTSGIFKGFYKNREGIGQFGGTKRNSLFRIMAPIEIPFPVFSSFECKVYVSQQEAGVFVRTLPTVDIAYLDPPYNQHPYGSNYFMLNLILYNKRPEEYSEISGIPKKWNRSDYNVRTKAVQAFTDLVNNIPARHLLISYNSEGFISFEEMINIISPLGDIKIYDQEYNTFRGSRNLSARSSYVKEFLFWVNRFE